MKRFLLRIWLVVPVLLVGIFALALVAQVHPRLEYILFAKGPFGSTFFRMPDFAQSKGPHDVVTLGSSTCNRGIDPRPFAQQGLSAFNLCSSSQTYFNSEYILEWSTGLKGNPRCVLMDIYPAIWDNGGLESVRDLTINQNLSYHTPFQRMAWATWDIPTILKACYFGLKRKLSPADRVARADLPFKYIEGGLSYTLMPPIDSLVCAPDTVVMIIKQARAFQRIRQTCEEEGIRLILINPPQLCEEVFEKPEVMEGLTWIEGNGWPLAKVDTLYYDDHHLRGVGAELYSEWLAAQVVGLIE